MESFDVGEPTPQSERHIRPELAKVESPHEASQAAATMAGIQQHDAAHDPEKPAVPTAAPDADSDITYLYLTFDTDLPKPNMQLVSPDNDLPSEPDLSPLGNPLNWPNTRKNIMLFLSCVATMLTAYSAGAYSPPADLLAAAFHVSRTAALTGITAFTAGFAMAPMVLAPFSEINGRYPVFFSAGFVFVISQALCGAMPDLAGMVVMRFIHGCGASVFSTMIGGVIADLWIKEERNTPMALYSGAVFLGTGLGPLVSSVMVYRWGHGDTSSPGATWRWVFWHQVLMDAALVLAIIICFKESRGSVLLSRRAKKLNEWYEELEEKGVFGVWMQDEINPQHEPVLTDTEAPAEKPEKKAGSQPTPLRRRESETTGFKLQRIRWLVKEDEDRTSLGKMIATAVERPFHLLFTEPVVFFFSLWVSFAWAVLYLMFGSIPFVFATQYGFNMKQTGLIFIAMIIGSVLATIIGVYQEELLKHERWQKKAGTADKSKFWSFMRRRFPVEVPESRLYITCIIGILLPLGLYLFGLSAHPWIHWISPAIAVVFSTMGIYFVYLAVFNYFADSYQVYASSALAAQSFCRNMLGGCFPLIVRPLFTNLGDDGAGALLGAIATALTVVPWVLACFGEKIRRRSKIAVALEYE